MIEHDWFDEYERAALADGDPARVQLARLHRDAYRFREIDPDQTLALIDAGRQVAQGLREPWWVLYYEQQRIHALLHFKQDYREVLDLAVRATLELGKQSNAHYPRRLLVYQDLVSAYLGIDPEGHAPAIREALEYLDRKTPPEGDERYLLLGNQRQFALDLGDLETAEACSQQSLALAAADRSASRARHFLVFTYSGLCEIAWRQGDASGLASAAEAGEETARLVGHQMELAGFLLWQALVLQRDGQPDEARDLYRQAATRMNRLRMPPDYSYRDAECAYLERADRLEEALAVREQERATIANRGRFSYEATCYLRCCELRQRLGILTPDDLASARTAAGRLRDPAGLLARLDRLASGGTP